MKEFALTEEQEEIAKDIRPGSMAIRGVAGSGKTSVGLRKLHYLAQERDLTKEKVLFVTFQNSLKGYLQFLLEEQFSDTKLDLGGSIEVDTIDSIVYQHYQKFKKNNPKYTNLLENANEKEAKKIFCETVQEILNDSVVKGFYHEELIDFWYEEVQFIISSRLVKEEEYLSLDRSHRIFERKELKITAISDQERSFIYNLRTAYVHRLLSKGILDWPTMRMLALKQAEKASLKKYTHIVIDECQDLDRVRLDLILALLEDNKQASITYLFDNDQSIFVDSWLGKGRSFESIGVDLKDRDYSLNKNYRTTREIQSVANDLLKEERGNTNVESLKLINKSGARPIYVHLPGVEEQLDYLSDVVKSHLETFNLRDILILSRKNRELDVIKEGLVERGVQCDLVKKSKSEYGRNQVRLMTMNAAKGLEAGVVILANLNADSIPAGVRCDADLLREKKILYVAMTRATKHLYLCSWGQHSSLLDEVEKEKLYLAKSTDRIRLAPELKRQNEWLAKSLLSLQTINSDLKEFEKQYVNLSTIECNQKMMNFVKEIEHLKNELNQAEGIICEGNVEYELFRGMLLNVDFMLNQHEERLHMVANKHDALHKRCATIVNERFPHFKVKRQNDLTGVMYWVEKNSIDPDKFMTDSTGQVVILSRVLERVISNILVQKSMLNQMECIDGTYQKPNFLGLIEMLSSLGDEEEQLMNLLESNNFRSVRNQVTHEKPITKNEFSRLYEEMFYETRIYDRLNDYLAMCKSE